jgi:hypothetical protein
MLTRMSEKPRRVSVPRRCSRERVRVALALGAFGLAAVGAPALACWLASLPDPEPTLARAAVVSPSVAFFVALLRFARQLLDS